MSGGSSRGAGRPKAEPAAQRRGALGSFLAPRPTVDVGMPSIRASLGRGLLIALTQPFFVVGIAVVLVAEWLVLVTAGFQGPFAILVHALGLPPVGTSVDLSTATTAFADSSMIPFIALTIVRGMLLAAIGAASVQFLRDGRVSSGVFALARKALPASLGVSFAAVSLLFVTQFAAAILGGVGGLGLFLLLGAFVFGVSAFGFVPAIAASEERRLGETLVRGWRISRLPGTGNLTLATLYVLPSFAILFSAPALPGGTIGVNPTPGAWLVVFAVNLVHVGVAAAYAFRYLSIADAVPEATRSPRGR